MTVFSKSVSVILASTGFVLFEFIGSVYPLEEHLTAKEKEGTKTVLDDAIEDKRLAIKNLTNTTDGLKNSLSTCTAWMKHKLVVISVDRLVKKESIRISKRHEKKLTMLTNLKRAADRIEDNPNEVIVNLTGQTLTTEQIDVLKLCLRHGVPQDKINSR